MTFFLRFIQQKLDRLNIKEKQIKTLSNGNNNKLENSSIRSESSGTIAGSPTILSHTLPIQIPFNGDMSTLPPLGSTPDFNQYSYVMTAPQGHTMVYSVNNNNTSNFSSTPTNGYNSWNAVYPPNVKCTPFNPANVKCNTVYMPNVNGAVGEKGGTQRSQLLDEFRNSRIPHLQLSDLGKHVVEFAQDQHGSRYLIYFIYIII